MRRFQNDSKQLISRKNLIPLYNYFVKFTIIKDIELHEILHMKIK